MRFFFLLFFVFGLVSASFAQGAFMSVKVDNAPLIAKFPYGDAVDFRVVSLPHVGRLNKNDNGTFSFFPEGSVRQLLRRSEAVPVRFSYRAQLADGQLSSLMFVNILVYKDERPADAAIAGYFQGMGQHVASKPKVRRFVPIKQVSSPARQLQEGGVDAVAAGPVE